MQWKRSLLFKFLMLALPLLILTGCISHQQHRTNYEPCISADPKNECTSSAIQIRRSPAEPDNEYWLGFVELDDQGQLWDRNQMEAVLDGLYQESASQDMIMVAFVHGWKHSAQAGDENIDSFRLSLERLSILESSINENPRRIVGVYMGWRGGSVKLPLIKELTFWDRKKTAHKVGSGGATEVFSRLELIKKTKAEIARSESAESDTRLIIIGHSFGGAVVYSAMSELLENGLVQTRGPDAVASNTVGFGDLIVLLNPAFEALDYGSMSDMANARATYFDNQLPVLAVLTSEADYATKLAFPAGRWLSTRFEKTRETERWNPVTQRNESIDQGDASISALGHFDPYKTHFLQATETFDDTSNISFNRTEEISAFLGAGEKWESDHPGSAIEFTGSTLYRTENSAGRNPYLIIRVDKELIRNHNDITDPRVGAFIRQLVLISSQSRSMENRKQDRSMAKKYGQ